MNTSKKIAATLAAVTLGTVAWGGLTAPPASAQGTTLPPATRVPLKGERHPELRRALASLERTETQLRKSARDFGGHREKAADLCHQAEQEVQLALQSDKS